MAEWQATNSYAQDQTWQTPDQSTGRPASLPWQNQANTWAQPTSGHGWQNQPSAQTTYPQQSWNGQSSFGASTGSSQPWNPAFNPTNYDLGNPMLNVGFQAGAHMVQEQAEIAAKRYMPGVSSFWGSLKKYFYVNNTFVLKKLSTLLFPFTKKNWDRTPSQDPPALDSNSPDLYIPLMALSTYVLTVGIAKGSTMAFDPEMIIDTFGTSAMIQTVEVLLLKVASMVLVPWVQNISWIELFAISGYQFVGVAINMVVGLLFGSFFYNLCLLWTATCAAFVMTQSLMILIPKPEPGQRGKRRRVNFFIIAAVLQLLVMWFLGYTRELRPGGVFLGSSSNVGDQIPKIPSAFESNVQTFPEHSNQKSTLEGSKTSNLGSDTLENENPSNDVYAKGKNRVQTQGQRQGTKRRNKGSSGGESTDV